jgi:hypothetical protein
MVSKDFQNYKNRMNVVFFDCASAWVIVKGKKNPNYFSHKQHF